MGTQTYRWNANDYAQHSTVQQQWARELIGKLRLEGREQVLDVGCGDGKVTAEIAGGVPAGSVTGIDNSAAMIALAQRMYPSGSFPNLRFQHGDACILNFEQEFDRVFSNAALHWIIDQRPVIQGIERSLKPGGSILLQMGGRGNASEVIAVLDHLMDEPEWRDYFKDFTFPYGFYDAEEYGNWLHDSGFKDIRTELIPKVAVHSGREGFESWIRTTWLPYTHRVPGEKKELFISTIADRYLRRHPMDAQGRVQIRMMRLEAEATKRSIH